MNNNADTKFQPDWASPPGHTILDMMCWRGMKVIELANKLKLSGANVNRLLDGRLEISLSLARDLSDNLGSTVDFWIAREHIYRKDLRYRQIQEEDWMSSIPIKDMTRFGWISESNSTDILDTCLRFFDVSDIRLIMQHEFNQGVRYRTSFAFDSLPAAVSVWVRQGERQADKLRCGKLDLTKFRENLKDVRAMTRIKSPKIFVPKLQELCAACGVAVVIVQSPTECKASGATFLTRNGVPTILLSGRHLTDDHLWFTFFHEAGHILMHLGEDVILDDECTDRLGQREVEADSFAESVIVPVEYKQELLAIKKTHRDIMRFSTKIGVSAGLVVGQMQHCGILPMGWLNGLKRRYKWVDNQLINQ